MSSIKGLGSLNKKLSKLANMELINKSLKDGAELIKEKAKDNAPVVTGNLRDSINYEINNNTAIIKAEAPYAPTVELGTLERKAKPFMEPAFNESKEEIIKDVKKEIKNNIGRL